MFIYFWERQRQNVSGLGAEREGDTETEAGSRLWAVSTEPNAGLKLTDRKIMTWAEVGCLTDWATQVPRMGLIFNMVSKGWKEPNHVENASWNSYEFKLSVKSSKKWKDYDIL